MEGSSSKSKEGGEKRKRKKVSSAARWDQDQDDELRLAVDAFPKGKKDWKGLSKSLFNGKRTATALQQRWAGWQQQGALKGQDGLLSSSEEEEVGNEESCGSSGDEDEGRQSASTSRTKGGDRNDREHKVPMNATRMMAGGASLGKQLESGTMAGVYFPNRRSELKVVTSQHKVQKQSPAAAADSSESDSDDSLFHEKITNGPSLQQPRAPAPTLARLKPANHAAPPLQAQPPELDATAPVQALDAAYQALLSSISSIVPSLAQTKNSQISKLLQSLKQELFAPTDSVPPDATERFYSFEVRSKAGIAAIEGFNEARKNEIVKECRERVRQWVQGADVASGGGGGGNKC